MLEPPAILAEQIAAHLQSAYSLAIKNVTFLPLGADPDTAVYRVAALDATAYFLKLRSGVFPEATVAVPAWLAHTGMSHLIAPIRAQTGAP